MTDVRPSDAGDGGSPAFAYFDIARALTMFGSEQSFRKILQMAHDSLSADVEQIADMLEAGDLQGAGHRLHGIKGFAPIFCGAALSTQIAEVERSSNTDAIDRVRGAYRDLMPALSQWRNEMAQYLARSGDAPRR